MNSCKKIEGSVQPTLKIIGEIKIPVGGNGGKDGISPTVEITPITGGNRITITDINGSKSADVMNGKDGPAGPAGVHVGTEAPTDGQTVWIDTDEEPEEEPEESGTKIDVVANVGQVIAVKAVGADSKPTEFEAVDLPKVTHPDFSANEGEEGYIKNRTHYIDEKGIVHKLSNKYIDADWMATSEDFIDPSIVIPEQKVTSTWSNRQMDIQPGIIYDVHINGVVYPCEAWGSGQSVYLGNNTSLTRNDYPFCIFWAGGTATSGMFFHNNTLESPIYMKVTGHSYTVYNKLPEEFLPEGVVKTVNGSKPDKKGNVSVEIPEGGGGSIDVTAEVGQTIVVEEVDDNGKPTKWKAAEYQPRTHWSEPVEVLPETTCEVIEDNGVAMLPDMAISAGDTLTVVFNGTEYICECADVDGSLAFGNWGAVQEEPTDTGEPFIVMHTWFDESTKVWVAMALDGSATFTLSVMGEVHNTIPEKYLPHRVVDVIFTVTYTEAGKEVITPNISYSEAKALAKTPNTEMRGVMKADTACRYFVLHVMREASNDILGEVVFASYNILSGEVSFDYIIMLSDGSIRHEGVNVDIK